MCSEIGLSVSIKLNKIPPYFQIHCLHGAVDQQITASNADILGIHCKDFASAKITKIDKLTSIIQDDIHK